MDFILYNGKIMHSADFNPGNLRMTGALVIPEEMWFSNGEIPFFDIHMDNLEASLSYLGNSYPALMPARNEILRLSRRVINKNKAFMGGWLRLQFALSDKILQYWAWVEPCPTRSFPFDATGKMASLGSCQKFSGNPPSRFAWFSETLWKTELLKRAGIRNEECIFLNERGAVTETAGANLFFIRKNSVATPSDTTGCYIDPIRELVMDSARELGFMTGYSGEILPGDLWEAEEIFIVSEGRGFKWIMGLDTRRFVKTKSELIWKQLNKSRFQPINSERDSRGNSPTWNSAFPLS